MLQALKAGNLAPGQRILIHAGSGGVGSAAIQIAKAWGLHVVTTASARNEQFLRVNTCALALALSSSFLESHSRRYNLRSLKVS